MPDSWGYGIGLLLLFIGIILLIIGAVMLMGWNTGSACGGPALIAPTTTNLNTTTFVGTNNTLTHNWWGWGLIIIGVIFLIIAIVVVFAYSGSSEPAKVVPVTPVVPPAVATNTHGTHVTVDHVGRVPSGVSIDTSHGAHPGYTAPPMYAPPPMYASPPVYAAPPVYAPAPVAPVIPTAPHVEDIHIPGPHYRVIQDAPTYSYAATPVVAPATAFAVQGRQTAVVHAPPTTTTTTTTGAIPAVVGKTRIS